MGGEVRVAEHSTLMQLRVENAEQKKQIEENTKQISKLTNLVNNLYHTGGYV